MDLKRRYDDDADNAIDELVELFGSSNPELQMRRKIKVLEGKLGLPPSEPEEKKYHLLEIPDH